MQGDIVIDSLREHLATASLSPEDKRLAYELVLGCIRRKGTLDRIITTYTGRDIKFVPRAVRAILSIGIYQIKFMDKIPCFAAVNESVELAKQIAGKKSAGFVNAVLRALLRNPQKIIEMAETLDPVSKLAFQESHPAWLIERLLKWYPAEAVEFFCAFNNTKPPISVRVMTDKISTDEFCALLEKHEVAYEKSLIHPHCIRLVSAPPVESIPGYQEGLFIVQDETLAVFIDKSAPHSGDAILDLCAAPGGKTIVLAQKTGVSGSVTAVDISPSRIALLTQTINRLNLRNIEEIIADASNLDILQNVLNNRKFDRIVIDAPCSNTGVLRKRVEARWRLKQSDFKRLACLQSTILKNAAHFLKPGGIILYITCSIDREENENIINRFLKTHPRSYLIEDHLYFPDTLHSGDGGFCAVLGMH